MRFLALLPVPSPPESMPDSSFAPTAEIALFIGGAFLTLLVMAFVAGLIVSIVREERAAARSESGEQSE